MRQCELRRPADALTALRLAESPRKRPQGQQDTNDQRRLLFLRPAARFACGDSRFSRGFIGRARAERHQLTAFRRRRRVARALAPSYICRKSDPGYFSFVLREWRSRTVARTEPVRLMRAVEAGGRNAAPRGGSPAAQIQTFAICRSDGSGGAVPMHASQSPLLAERDVPS